MREIEIKNEKETELFAKELSKKIKAGTVIGLVGDLGTGKTTLTKYIGKELGICENMTSPTFTIVKEYKSGKLPIYHFDVYRIGSIEEMYEIGYEEYFFGKGVTIVEWADKISEILPADTLKIEITYGEKLGERKYKCTF